jgi:PAS domain S-box-containing protein
MGEAVKIGALAALANWIASRWTMAEGSLGISHAALQVKADERIASLTLLIDMIPVIVGIKTTEGSSDFINKRWQEYTGLSPEEGLGYRWTAAIHPDDVASLLDAWRTATTTGEVFEREARLRRADGEYRWFMRIGLSISRSIVSDHGGQLWIRENEGPGSAFQFSIPTFK